LLRTRSTLISTLDGTGAQGLSSSGTGTRRPRAHHRASAVVGVEIVDELIGGAPLIRRSTDARCIVAVRGSS
jgi:hypothetical protein